MDCIAIEQYVVWYIVKKNRVPRANKFTWKQHYRSTSWIYAAEETESLSFLRRLFTGKSNFSRVLVNSRISFILPTHTALSITSGNDDSAVNAGCVNISSKKVVNNRAKWRKKWKISVFCRHYTCQTRCNLKPSNFYRGTKRHVSQIHDQRWFVRRYIIFTIVFFPPSTTHCFAYKKFTTTTVAKHHRNFQSRFSFLPNTTKRTYTQKTSRRFSKTKFGDE